MVDAKEINRFWDKYGTLDKLHKPDGGDSCHRIGMYYSLLGMMPEEKRKLYPRSSSEDFKKVAKLHHVSPGVLVRHPNPKWDASDWDRMSRDQLQSFIIACGFYDQEELTKLTMGHALRGLFFTNNTRDNGATKANHGSVVSGALRDYGWKLPDVTGPEIFGNFLRAWNLWYLWPILLFTDLELLGGAIKWRFFPKHNIAMNQTLAMLQAMKRLPTPLSWLARKIMPIPRMIEYIADHFDDFDNAGTPLQDDMLFFKQMFEEAYV